LKKTELITTLANSKTKKNKDKDKDKEVAPYFILSPSSDESPKLRMIGLYEDLNNEKVGDICTAFLALKEMGRREIYEDPEDFQSPIKEIVYDPIDFYISTPGGLALGMFAVYDVMRMIREDCEIRTYGFGRVMSAGVLLLASGTRGKRKIGKNCRVMLHAVAGGNWGPIYNLENEMEEIRWIQEQYTQALVNETHLTKKHIKKMLDRKMDVYLNAQQAVEYGIADEII